MTVRAEGLRVLPAPARSLVLGITVAAVVLATAAILMGTHSPSPGGLVALAFGIALGEYLRVDLPFRRGGTAQINLGDAALTVGLFLMPPAEVVLAACVGKLAWQLIDRVPRLKLSFNLAWFVTGTSLAALIVHAIAPRPGPIDAQTLLAVGLGLGALMSVNTIAVSGIIALSGGQPWLATARRLVPTATLLTVSNAGLGVLAVLLADDHPWALVALSAPLMLLYTSSREQVHATLERERSKAAIAVEHRLSEASDPQAVLAGLAEAVGDVLGLQAAVWGDGGWLTPPPPDTPAGDPTDPRTAVSVDLPPTTRAPLGDGHGTLVAWPGDLGVTTDAPEWLERLARSGRVHLDRATAHVALEQERATLRAVVDGTGDGILVVDDAGAVRLWNAAMARLAGTPPAQALGRSAEHVLGDGPWSTPGVHEVGRTPASPAPGGYGQVWRVSVAPLRDRSHGGLHVAVVHDVSAERRVARMKDDMLAVVSHELRTPLTPIKASAQLLRTRWDAMAAEQRGELLGHIEGRADHLTRLVEDLLLVGQLSAGHGGAKGDRPAPAHPNVVPVDVDLTRLLREDLAQLALARPDHQITFAATGEDPVVATTDPLRLRQIVDNLVDNACKFSPVGSSVRVSLRSEDGHAVLVVRDEGRGIAGSDLDRILEPFERGEDPLHMTTSGAGLGLYIVRALTEALHGELLIHSEPAAGTTVTVRLPLRHPAIAAA